uniref:Putative TnpX site-specific recombinase family protein n=1 Tax=termite gut metagenome TaxID=433724 RepID=S0DGQ6_9ZZZZ
MEDYALGTCAFEDDGKAVNVDRFLTLVRKYTTIEELTPAIVHEFIETIVVHEAEGGRKNRTQKMVIVYANMGAIDCAAALTDEADDNAAAAIVLDETTGDCVAPAHKIGESLTGHYHTKHYESPFAPFSSRVSNCRLSKFVCLPSFLGTI